MSECNTSNESSPERRSGDYEELDWDCLLVMVKEKDEQLTQAGSYGVALHERLMDTQAHIDEIRMENDLKCQKMFDEICELQNKVDLKEKSIIAQQLEFESMQRQTQEKFRIEQKELETAQHKDMSALKKKNDSLLAEIDQVRLNEFQLNKHIEELQQTVSELHKKHHEHEERVASPTPDYLGNRDRMVEMEDELAEKNEVLRQLQNKNESLLLQLQSKCNDLDGKTIELEEAESQSTVYYNHLQKVREENNEIQAELDSLKAGIKSSGHSLSGNSLFAEVEDKRLEMEKRCKEVNMKYDSLSKSYNFIKNQHHTLKLHLTSLMSMNSGEADVERIKHLERALSQTKTEYLELQAKLNAGTAKESDPTADELLSNVNGLSQFRDSKTYIDYLSKRIKRAEEDLEKKVKELESVHMIKMCESDKLHTVERKLHDTAKRYQKEKNDCMKLRMKLEETNNHLATEKRKVVFLENKFSFECPNEMIPIGRLTEQKPKQPQQIPYTLAKAKEKSDQLQASWNNKNTEVTRESRRSAKMSDSWDTFKFSPSLLEELGIKKSENGIQNSNADDNKENLASEINSVFCDEQPTMEKLEPTKRCKKVSFKEGEETIGVSVDEQCSPIPENNEKLSVTSEPKSPPKVERKVDAAKPKTVKMSPLGPEEDERCNMQ